MANLRQFHKKNMIFVVSTSHLQFEPEDPNNISVTLVNVIINCIYKLISLLYFFVSFHKSKARVFITLYSVVYRFPKKSRFFYREIT